MELFNLFSTGTPGGPRRALSSEENLACGLGLVLLPALAFLIVVLGRGWIWDHGEIALVALPALLSLINYAAARRLGTSVGFALQVTIGCGFAWFISASAGGLIAALVSFTQTF